MCDVSDANLKPTVDAIRSDADELTWAVFGFKGNTDKLEVQEKGTGSASEAVDCLADDKAQFALLRVISGDQESRRVKFVFISWTGENLGGLKRGRAFAARGTVQQLVGQFHVEFQTDDKDDLTEEAINAKIKASSGADYDQGNKQPYKSSASEIRAKALGTYKQKEAEGNIGPVKYVTTALPHTTPCDLSGRPMVAPPSEARRNMNLAGNLDLGKFESSNNSAQNANAAAEAAAAVSKVEVSDAAAPAPAEEPAAPAEEPAAPAEEPAAPAEEPAAPAEEPAAPAEEPAAPAAPAEEPAAPAEEPAAPAEEPAAPAEEPAAPAEEPAAAEVEA